MKSKRRHELQHNVLHSELTKILAFFKNRGNYIFGGLLVAAIIGLIVVYAVRKSRAKRIEPELRYYDLMNDASMKPDERESQLENLAGQDDNRHIAGLACLHLGDLYANRLVGSLPTLTRAERKEFAEKAHMYYHRAIDEFAAQPLSVARGRFGLAELAISEGDYDAARAHLEAISAQSDLAGQPVKEHAERRLTELERLAVPVRMATTAPAKPPEPVTTDVVPTTAPTSTRPAK